MSPKIIEIRALNTEIAYILHDPFYDSYVGACGYEDSDSDSAECLYGVHLSEVWDSLV